MSTLAILILAPNLLFNFNLAVCFGDEIRPVGANAYQMVTGDDSEDDRKRWDRFYNIGGYVYGKEPAPFLMKYLHFIPSVQGARVLDLAMGEGRNAVFLAKKGFVVDGVDISEVALRKAKRLARENHVSFNTVLADLTNYTIKPESYHVILNFDYMQKSLISEIKRGLKKKGVIVYENHTVDQLQNRAGQNVRRDYLLNRGELKELFKDFDILVYEETNDGKNAKASLIARKP